MILFVDTFEQSSSGSRCNGYKASKRILGKMSLSKEIQDKFLELCHHYGGCCDCEILFNAKPKLLSLDYSF